MADTGGQDRRSLYDGFEGYRTVAREEVAAALSEGLIVPDANVLLNLYRYTPDARENLLSVLRKLASNLWVPHQVLVEFWRNRESVIRDPGDSDKTVDSIATHCGNAINDLRSWANRVSLPPETTSTLVGHIQSGFDQVASEVRALSAATNTDFSYNTEQDAVLKELEEIVAGRVGAEMSREAHAKAVAEGLRRVANQEPPGYKDKNKGDSRAAGDYIVWEQVLTEAEARKKPVVFVTGDNKEDWWRVEAGQRRGPRVELVQEMLRRTGQLLLMVRPSQLLEYAKNFLEVEVSADSVRDVENIDSAVSRSEEVPPGGGWTVKALTIFMISLSGEAKVQAEVIKAAAAQSGFVSRDQVYEIAEYSPQRSLRGFTRPVNRIAQFVKGVGLADEKAVDILLAVYNDDSPEVGWAAGFRLHPEVLPMIQQVIADGLELPDDDG
ncbi:PIN domain-containing protein [Saccharothrix sp. NPDC042600]|uniref:PIN domain-containing protein n=1 Tax=Saccharothrix TaxID=2071 RepID=UPI0033C42576|nr:hypothetical protein GCM10017745_24740 [Saccharothrix mutabilis subsp. capreolus]